MNFAHTFGHAIETVTSYQIPHGTAVAIGMIMANHISVSRGLLDSEIAARMEQVLLRVIHISVNIAIYSFDEFLASIKKDKKQVNDNLTAVLMTDIPEEMLIVHDVQKNEIKEALQHFQRICCAQV